MWEWRNGIVGVFGVVDDAVEAFVVVVFGVAVHAGLSAYGILGM